MSALAGFETETSVEDRSARAGNSPGARGSGGARKTLSNILCCLCGRSIQPNGANMCGACLQDQVDITEDIPKKGIAVMQCRRCLKWLTKNDHWSNFEPESTAFLALMLKKIPGLTKQDVVDAKWVWTEPHSKRLKVRVTIRKEVLNKVMLQRDATVEFVVQNRQCNGCNKDFTNQTWKAVVQMRQRTGHKRTMLLLEQRILKADAHKKSVNIEMVRGGIDVYFAAKQDALEFVGFLSSVAPIRSRESTKLVSTDNHSNVRNSQHTIAVDIPTLCRDDLVILPKGAGNRLQGTLCVVHRVTSVVQFVGPFSGETAEMATDRYWRATPEPLLSAASMVEFMVLDCEPADASLVGPGTASGRGGGGTGGRRAASERRLQLWEVVVTLSSEMGSEDDTFRVLTHIGGASGSGGRQPLEAGDTLLGYDLRGENFNDALVKGLSSELPDVVLVKRAPPPKNTPVKKKRAKLRSLGAAGSGASEGGKLGRRKAASAPASVDDEQEVAALLEELSMDEELQAELGVTEEEMDEAGRHEASMLA